MWLRGSLLNRKGGDQVMGALDLASQNRQVQLLKDLLAEQRKTNELLTQLLLQPSTPRPARY